ncbi:Zn-ribbon domain-containing OB-fold protein [Rhodoferax sp.]|uniref:Zn-ribbon domain-containing OB-fold protein n=1 Tax=Rhodoferax sp. TaxID=50421 RepID=UPI002716E400|nr:OB-fold domain-containing protein [Rhodoferax sp.]MDO9195402.1 OB-fold domain-containing protein [Rhodoferax sp.]
MSDTKDMNAPLEVPYTDWKPEYLYSQGEVSRFFREIMENKRLYASRCAKCNLTWMPPRGHCPECHDSTEWVPLSGEGTVRSATYCYFAGMAGDLVRHLELPYVLALIQLDGCDTYLCHGVKPPRQAMGDIVTGTRVKAVFRDERRGSIADFYFEKQS